MTKCWKILIIFSLIGWVTSSVLFLVWQPVGRFPKEAVESITKNFKTQWERMNALDRKIDARIKTERNTKILLEELGKELKINGEK